MDRDSILRIPDARATYLLFAAIALVLTLITFGSLYEHLYDAFDDKEHIEVDIARSIDDLSFLFSQKRTYLVRPITDALLMVCYLVWENDPRPYHLLVVFFHFATTLLLIYAFRQSGIGLELSLIAGLLFLMNVAHFRAIHWITCLDRVLALTWALGTLIFFQSYLKQKRVYQLVLTWVTLAGAIFSHPSAVSLAPICAYLSWRQSGQIGQVIRQSWPIALTAIVFGLLTYLVSPHHPQVGGVSASPDPLKWIQNLLWYLGRTVTAAHWLPQLALHSSWNPGEIIVGAGVLLGILILYRQRQFPTADWGVWAVLTVLPFLNHPASSERWLPVGPSRHLYLTTAGTSLVLAWLLYHAIKKWGAERFQRPILVTALIVLTYSSLVSLKASEAPSFYLSGRRYAAAEDFQTAEDRFLRALASSYASVPRDIYSRLAGVSLAQGRFPESEFQIARAHWPDDLRIQTMIGISAYLKQDPAVRQQGDRLLQNAINQSPDPASIRSIAARMMQNLGGYYLESKNYREAEKLYYRALQIKPDYAMAYYNLGNALNAQNKTTQAIDAYRKALDLQASYIEPLQNLANSLFKKDQIENARVIYEEITRKMPKDATAHYNLGITLAKQGNLSQAHKSFETANALVPQDLDIQLKLAETLYEQGQLDSALAHYQKIYEQHPENQNASYNLAVILIQKDRKQDALEALKNALKYAPDDPTVLVALAFVYELMGRYTQALEKYQSANAYNTSLTEALQGIQRIKELQDR